MWEVLTSVRFPNICHEPITFTLEYGKGMVFSYEDALVMSTVLSNHRVYRVLMDYISAINILSSDMMAQIRINLSRSTLVNNPFIGIASSDMLVKGALKIPITITTYLKCLTLKQIFIYSHWYKLGLQLYSEKVPPLLNWRNC